MCVIWQHYPRIMYNHLHTIGLTGATELGIVTCHFAPNQRRFQWSISRWILLRRNNIIGKKFKVELKFICAEFQIFSTLIKHDITILIIISHGNRSLTSYIEWYEVNLQGVSQIVLINCRRVQFAGYVVGGLKNDNRHPAYQILFLKTTSISCMQLVIIKPKFRGYIMITCNHSVSVVLQIQ